ncbi:MAG: YfiR family protein [Casimicrobiaceae bacterium]
MIAWLGAAAATIARVAGVCALAFASGAMAADVDRGLERAVKAAYLYKFLNYVDWPDSAFADARAPYVIGIYGADDIAQELTKLATARPPADRPVQVRRLARGESLDGLHVLFLGAGAGNLAAMLAQSAQQRSLLVVTESDRAPAAGAAINLVVADGRVRFDAFLDPAERAGIHLSSRLLAVARNVRSGAE